MPSELISHRQMQKYGRVAEPGPGARFRHQDPRDHRRHRAAAQNRDGGGGFNHIVDAVKKAAAVGSNQDHNQDGRFDNLRRVRENVAATVRASVLDGLVLEGRLGAPERQQRLQSGKPDVRKEELGRTDPLLDRLHTAVRTREAALGTIADLTDEIDSTAQVAKPTKTAGVGNKVARDTTPRPEQVAQDKTYTQWLQGMSRELTTERGTYQAVLEQEREIRDRLSSPELRTARQNPDQAIAAGAERETEELVSSLVKNAATQNRTAETIGRISRILPPELRDGHEKGEREIAESREVGGSRQEPELTARPEPSVEPKRYRSIVAADQEPSGGKEPGKESKTDRQRDLDTRQLPDRSK